MVTALSERLQELRKQNGLSQEALAEKMGLSRQAISKWERAESAPDTENLIALASVYNVGLDSLLQSPTKEPSDEAAENTAEEAVEYISESTAEKFAENSGELNLADAKTDSGKTFPDIISTVITDEEKEQNASNDNCGKEKSKSKQAKENQDNPYPGICKKMLRFPFVLIVILLYACAGMFFKLWHPAWMIFLTVPLYYLCAFSFAAKSNRSFRLRFPVWYVVTLVFLIAGFLVGLWKYAWVLFLTLPIYYWWAARKQN